MNMVFRTLPVQLAPRSCVGKPVQSGSEAPCLSFRDLYTKVSKSLTSCALRIALRLFDPRDYLIPFSFLF